MATPPWFGKNHNTPAFAANQAGPFDQWPIDMGCNVRCEQIFANQKKLGVIPPYAKLTSADENLLREPGQRNNKASE